MKKFKSIVSLLLVAVLICLSGVTAFAEEYDEVLDAKINELSELCEEAFFAFGTYGSLFYDFDPGTIFPNFLTVVDRKELANAHYEAAALCGSYYYGEKYVHYVEVDLEAVIEKYNNLYEVLHNVVIDRIEVEELVAICEKESNDDCYYDEELWNGFQAEITQAKELLADESIVDQRVTTAFYELMYQYNL
ncbi:MAG: hypothetical protein IJ015_05450, partial [Ruminococcus sp.]|nr:hypothetical protein [Ruminococcus sp.]